MSHRCHPGALALAVFLPLVCVFGGPVAARADALSARQAAQIDTIVTHAMAEQHVVGAEVAVGRNGKLLYLKGYGLRNQARRLPVTSRTVFGIGSITKQFTAACVLMLVQEGKVKLDARVATYLPNAPHASEITVRELLDQTSGLHDYLENKPLIVSIMGGTDEVHRAPAYYVNLTRGMPLMFKPGSKFTYSNTNYVLAGMIVAKVSGETYEQFLFSHIMRPLGLRSMQFPAFYPPSGPDVSQGYNYVKGVYSLVPRYDMTWGGAAGELASSATDLITWDGAFFGGRVLAPETVLIATTPPDGIPLRASKHPETNIAQGYAMGWVAGQDEGRDIIWHNGGIVGARSMNATFPGDGLEVVVLTNMTAADPDVIAIRIARAIYSR